MIFTTNIRVTGTRSRSQGIILWYMLLAKRQIPLIFAQPFYARSTLYTFIVGVAKLPSAKLLWRLKLLISTGSVGWAVGACAAAAVGAEMDSTRLDALDKVVEVETLLTDCAAAEAAPAPDVEVVLIIMALESVGELTDPAPAADGTGDEIEDETELAPAAPVCPVFAIGAVDSVAELMATVDRVVPAGAGAWPMAAMLGNEPAPQRHAQLQDPSELRIPDPEATAPGEPTETAGAAEAMSASLSTDDFWEALPDAATAGLEGFAIPAVDERLAPVPTLPAGGFTPAAML